MKIKELSIRNFKIIGDICIKPLSRIIRIYGRNGQGKSTVFDAFQAAVGGAKAVPAKPIKSGKSKSQIVAKLDAGDGRTLIVEKTFTAKTKGDGFNTEFLVYGEGEKQGRREPQTILDGLMSAVSLDPSKFALMDKEKQFDILRSLVQLTDSNGNPVDPKELDRLNADDYQERARLNRRHKELSAELSVLSDQLPAKLALPEKEIDISEVSARLAEASEHNSTVRVAEAQRTAAITRLEGNINLAKRKQEEARAALEKAEADQKRFELELTAARAVDVGGLIDTQQLATTIQTAQETNRLIQVRNRRDDLATQAKTAFLESENLTDRMKEREKAKKDALESAKFPVKGLEFGEGEVIYRGEPFTQAAYSEKIRVGCAIAMALKPKLRVMSIQHGNDLDATAWNIVGEMAEEQDWQVWTEIVKDDDIAEANGITIVDGYQI